MTVSCIFNPDCHLRSLVFTPGRFSVAETSAGNHTISQRPMTTSLQIPAHSSLKINLLFHNYKYYTYVTSTTNSGRQTPTVSEENPLRFLSLQPYGRNGFCDSFLQQTPFYSGDKHDMTKRTETDGHYLSMLSTVTRRWPAGRLKGAPTYKKG